MQPSPGLAGLDHQLRKTLRIVFLDEMPAQGRVRLAACAGHAFAEFAVQRSKMGHGLQHNLCSIAIVVGVNVLSHVFIGASDFERAYTFYAALAEVLGIQPRFVERDRPWAGWQTTPGPRPLLLIGKPFNGEPHAPGNGQMVALLARTREQVDTAYRLALEHGGTSEGAPGLRPEYHENYYGAYVRDTEGNKLCVVCHSSVE